ncbi:ABA4-like family protein [Sphingomonas sp. BN140010]|uniref:ABA4-like family protein n=1 Tax=Sphingomonas arvum TaxID=2992113 RepID=A0ABT3JIC0_9SPHN|nr:ABA4-like family protein [Sphingomonas sp. BN140010]MCW3798828.1 ABA4-like family protein [Sphingomonas sp. BN140010]
MGWGAVWSLVHVAMAVGWAALFFLPRRPAIHSFILYAGVGALCAAYLAMFVALFGGLADPVPVAGQGEPDLLNYSIGGVRSLFMSDGGTVLGWTHYLAFDLFVGLWISRDADAKGFSRWAQAPVLFLTVMAGPIGLLTWLIVRERRARRGA